MDFNPDAEIDRRGSDSVKWEFVPSDEDLLRWQQTDRFCGGDRVLPMWVADMDFICPKPVVEALTARAQHGIYGLAGLQTSCIVIPNPALRSRFKRILQSNGLFGIGTFGVVALQAAYDHGEEWLAQVLEYLEGNPEYLERHVAEHIPQLSIVRPEGTYLVWLDCRRLQLDKWELKRLMREQARVYLDEGFIFGSEGEGFERINIACPRAILVETLDRIAQAIKGLPGGVH